MSVRFVEQIRRNLDAWRTREIDYVTFTLLQQETWAAVSAVGRRVEAEVLRALWGAPSVWDQMLAEDQRGTVQLRTINQAPPSLTGRYRGELLRTVTGSPVLRVTLDDAGRAEHRELAALIYELAADLERRSYQLEAHWTISADAENGQIVIELSGEHEDELANDLAANLMDRYQLI